MTPAYWPHRLAGRAAWRRHCPSGEGARHQGLQWRRFGNGLTAARGDDEQRECDACEHPQRARDPWPEASTSAKSGSVGTDYSRVPPGRAVVVEAERSRVERGRPRDRGPARSGGCGGTSQRFAQSGDWHDLAVTHSLVPRSQVQQRGGKRGAAQRRVHRLEARNLRCNGVARATHAVEDLEPSHLCQPPRG